MTIALLKSSLLVTFCMKSSCSERNLLLMAGTHVPHNDGWITLCIPI
uniref:Uncharacterized protein n=1 Tax=Arundo donax TaxID=35708 RepID=A0A0A9A3M0_ARUDO